VVSDATLNRFFSFPRDRGAAGAAGLVVAHIIALHEVGSNNPDGVEIKAKKDPKTASRWTAFPSTRTTRCTTSSACRVPDGVLGVVFFAPEMGGYFLEFNNFIPADPLKTPAHIAPGLVLHAVLLDAACHHRPDDVMRSWPAAAGASSVLKGQLAACFKALVLGSGRGVGIALLVAIDAKFWGVVVMGAAVLILFFLPWLDNSPVKSIRYRPPGTSGCTACSWWYFLCWVTSASAALGALGERSRRSEPVLLRLLPADAVVEPHGQIQAVPDRVTFTPH
jgi:ubiquinol-cytochrome c reductase cytochrome b subunit